VIAYGRRLGRLEFPVQVGVEQIFQITAIHEDLLKRPRH